MTNYFKISFSRVILAIAVYRSHGNPRVPKVCGARHTRARSRDHKKSETLLGQHSATVGTELCLSCNKWCSIRGWNYGTDSSFYASFLHFQCTSTHQRKRQRSKCVYWYFFTNNIPTIFKWQASRESNLKENFRKHSYQPMNQLNQINWTELNTNWKLERQQK